MKLLDEMRDFATTAHTLGQYDVEQIVNGWVDHIEKLGAIIPVVHPAPIGIPDYVQYNGRLWHVFEYSRPEKNVSLEALCGAAIAHRVPLADCTHIYLTPLNDPEEYDDEI